MPSQAQVLWFMDACRSVLNFSTLDVFIRAPTYHSSDPDISNSTSDWKVLIALGRKELKRRMKAYVEHGSVETENHTICCRFDVICER
ncbi:hypothetical protein L1987_72855 [Smallanthus sonchifolius]|uniref:Uncharacterized protein n=1 Tax=Smallanthus sonchifolius TaxID=185202 RepID=A0ACB9AY17_9ASTR|nr:hypothetical protein L1987_72855 [Smallanthus sonchifolius]